MIVTQASRPVYPQATPAPASLPPEPVVTDTSEPIAKGGARGITLLSRAAAAVVIAQQNEPTPAPAGLDLSGRDLREEDLSKLDLRGANLTGVDLTGKDLTGVDLSGATLTSARLDGANLTDSTLDGVKAKGASFKGAMLLRTGMDGADLSNAKFNDAFISDMPRDVVLTTFEQQRDGKYFSKKSVDFTNADFSGASIKNGMFLNSKFDGATFNGVTASFGMKDSSATNASFQAFSGSVSIRGGEASGADFSHTDGAYVSISSAKVDGVSFAESKLTLSMQNIDARNVDFSFKDKTFNRASFQNVNMAGKDFSGYKFVDTNFQVDKGYASSNPDGLSDVFKGTNFSGASFQRVGIAGCAVDLNKANFDGATFERVFVGGMTNIDKTKAITDGLSAGKIFYDVPGQGAGMFAGVDSPARGYATPEDRKIQDWLVSLMPPPKTYGAAPEAQSAKAAGTNKDAGETAKTAAIPAFDMRKALTEAGALEGPGSDSNPYSYVGDLFDAMQSANNVAPDADDYRRRGSGTTDIPSFVLDPARARARELTDDSRRS